MAIKGSLKEASLPDVLQLLSMGKKTGCLAVTLGTKLGDDRHRSRWGPGFLPRSPRYINLTYNAVFVEVNPRGPEVRSRKFVWISCVGFAYFRESTWRRVCKQTCRT